MSVGASLTHIACHTCNAARPGTRLTGLATSLCGQYRAHIRPRASHPLCVVCVDITGGGTCRAGHRLASLEEMFRG